jgi:hypothetical protein
VTLGCSIYEQSGFPAMKGYATGVHGYLPMVGCTSLGMLGPVTYPMVPPIAGYHLTTPPSYGRGALLPAPAAEILLQQRRAEHHHHRLCHHHQTDE